MKKRFIIFITTFISIILLAILFRFLISSDYHGIVDNVALMFLVLDLVFLFFGLPRFVVYNIYSFVVIPSLVFSPEKYHLLLIFIFTVVILLNPLAFFEEYLDEKLKDSSTKTFDYTPPGRYHTFYKYREEMKNRYHLPQMQKVYTKPTYRSIRTISLITLFFLLIFLLLFSSSDIIIGQGIESRSIMTLYLAVLLSLALVVLYKKGFTSMFRVFKVGIFPPIIYVILTINLNPIAKIISGAVLALALVSVIIVEVIANYSRVIYSSYKYVDQNTNEKIWANALYEPFIYNTDKKENILFEFNLPENIFLKNFQSLLISTNFRRTIITAYTIKQGRIRLYIEFYNRKKVEKVKEDIKKVFNLEEIKTTVIDDNYYEKKFLHNHEYIISRALKLAHLLIELNVKEQVIVSVLMHFKTISQAQFMATNFQTVALEQTEEYCLIESSFVVENEDYLIETNLRSLLLEMLINGGTFVRVMVYY